LELENARGPALSIGILALIIITWTLAGHGTVETVLDRPAVDIWYPWAGETGDAFRELVDIFNESRDDLYIRVLYAPNDLSASQKFFLSVAGGVPPEIVFVDGPQVAEWAERNAIMDVSALAEAAGLSGDDFWGPCWGQVNYRGSVYAIPYAADPNFALFWNREAFRRAGLDADSPPATIAQLDDYARRLTTFEGRSLRTIGFIPWAADMANCLYTFGWIFGGRFYDYDNDLITCDEPEIGAALSWMLSYADWLDVTRISTFSQAYGARERNPFYVGDLAMMMGTTATLRDIERYMPDLDFSLAPMPVLNEGDEPVVWMGGWCLGIPRGAKRPELAFEFIKWVCTSPEGTLSLARVTGSFPAFRNSPAYEEAAADPRRRVFLDMLDTARYQRPVMPVQAKYTGELRRAADHAMYRRNTVEAGLAEARERTQAELDRVLGAYR